MAMVGRITARRSRATQRQHGIVIVQVALTMGIFLLLVMTLIEFALSLYRTSALEEALARTARSAVVGYGLSAPVRILAIKSLAQSYARELHVKIEQDQIKICPANTPNCSVESVGASGDFFVMKAELGADFLFQHHLKSEAVVTMRNE